jgi:predicted AAA+ superfamily ATPase
VSVRSWFGKRLVKSPKILIRDSGLTHALLGLKEKEDILGHPILGPSWESFVVETLIRAAPEGATASFYRTAAGAEIDLLLELSGGRIWAIAIKRGLAPKIERGFHNACADLSPERRFVVYSGVERFALAAEVEAVSLPDLAGLLASKA